MRHLPADALYGAARIFVLITLCCLPGRAQVNILTGNGDNDRTNANLQEVRLAPATVTPDTFGKLGAFPVDGQVYSQPLYVSGLSIPGRGALNVLFVSTMHNSVYAFNADSMSPIVPLWHVNLGPSLLSSQLIHFNDITVELGILGTPVIDLQRSVLYVVSETVRQGSPVFYIHALDLASGQERMNGPVAITAAVPGTGSGALANGTVRFDPWQHLQRPALLLANDAVYVAFGSHGDQSPWHGWLMSYDASNLARQIGVFISTPSGDGGAIWQSGRGPAADERGNVYLAIGNGDYDGVENFSQSFLKITGAAPTRAGSFTPSDWKSMSDNDADLSAGPALIPGTHTMIGADKNGNLYVLNGDAMEQGGNENSNSAQYIFDVSRGSIFNVAVWSRPGNPYIYLQGSKEPVQCYQLVGGFNPSPVSATSDTTTFSRIGMTLSANGGRDDTGILWQTTGNYNDPSAPGALHAFDASNLAIELWNSDMNAARDRMGSVAKFVGPTVANGKVYVPTFSNTVVVYGLLPLEGIEDDQPVITAVENAAGYSQDAVSPGELVAIFGSNLGPEIPAGMQFDAFGLVSTKLADAVALFDGIPGPMAYASANQVNAIAPFGLASQSAQVQIGYQGRLSDPVRIAVAPSAPGVFSADGSGSGQGLIMNQDGTLNAAGNPASLGSVIVLYATGAGLFSPGGVDGAVVTADSLPRVILGVTAEVGAGQQAEVLYAGGGPGIVEGIIQVNLRIPNGAPTGPAVPIVLRIGDRASQTGLTVALTTGDPAEASPRGQK